MSDTTHDVEVRFTAKDLTSKVIGNITKAAGGLSKRVDAITSSVAGFAGTFGGLGAVFGFGASVASANSLLMRINDLSAVTGQTANRMAAMDDAMSSVGIASEDTRGIIVALAQKQTELLQGSEDLAKMSKRYGIELKKGPQEALLSMSKSIMQQKMGAGQVAVLLGDAGTKAMVLMRKGPKEMQRLLDQGAKKNAHITDRSVKQYEMMTTQMTRVKQAWTRIVSIVLIKLAPKLTALMAYVESRIEGWAEGAAEFGDFLVTHMDSALKTARVFGKVMAANFLLMKLTGEGLLGNAGKMLQMAKTKQKVDAGSAVSSAADVASNLISGGGRKGGGGKISGRAGAAAKGKMGKGANMFIKVFKRMPNVGANVLLSFKKIQGVTGKIGGGFKKFLPGFLKVFSKVTRGVAMLGPIVKFLLKLSGLALIVAAVVKGIQMAMKNVDGIRQKITKLLGGIWDDIKAIGGELANMFGKDSTLGQFLQFIGHEFLNAVTWILGGVKNLTAAVRIFVKMAANFIDSPLGTGVSWDLAKAQVGADKGKEIHKHMQKAAEFAGILQKTSGKVTEEQLAMFKNFKAQAAEAGKSNELIMRTIRKRGLKRFLEAEKSGLGMKAPKDRPKNNFDFRGSRFDIQQNFAEGFDPDRIAAAFTNDLAGVGERRLSSGLAPAFAV